MKKKNKILFLLWENPKSHEVLVHIFKKFSKNYDIKIFCQSNLKIDRLNFNGFYKKKNIINSYPYFFSKNFFLNKFCLIYFYLGILKEVIFSRPKIIYIINQYPLFLLPIFVILRLKNLIYHNLDYEAFPKLLFHRILKKILFKNINNIKLIIFSHPKRTNYFVKELKKKKIIIKTKFITFYNYLPKKNHFLRKKKINNKKCQVVYFGTIGPNHGLIKLIKSFEFLNDYYQLKILGWSVSKSYLDLLYFLIKKHNLNDRVLIKTDLKDNLWKKYLQKSDIGAAIYEKVNLSHRYMFGASQKISNYLQAGLPIITDNSADMKEISNKYPFIFPVKLNPKKIALKVIKIYSLNNYVLQNQISRSIKKDLNFESQFTNLEKFL